MDDNNNDSAMPNLNGGGVAKINGNDYSALSSPRSVVPKKKSRHSAMMDMKMTNGNTNGNGHIKEHSMLSLNLNGHRDGLSSVGKSFR